MLRYDAQRGTGPCAPLLLGSNAPLGVRINSTYLKATAAVVGLASVGALSTLALDAPAPPRASATIVAAPSDPQNLGLARDAAARSRASRSRAIAGKAESLRLREAAAHRAALQKAARQKAARQKAALQQAALDKAALARRTEQARQAAQAQRAEQLRAAARRTEQARAVRLRAAAQARPTPTTRRPTNRSAASSSFSDTELRIRSCESGPQGSATNGHAHDADYSAQNPSSTASGAWQFLDSTWNGYGGYARASSAPRSVQDAKARSYIDANGYGAWEASRSCWSA